MPSQIGIVQASGGRGGGGAIAVLGYGGGELGLARCDVFDMPVIRDGGARSFGAAMRPGQPDPDPDLARLTALLETGTAPARAVVQRPRATLRRSAEQIFTSGRAHGTIVGVLAGLGIAATAIDATLWQRDLGVAANPDVICARADELFPDHAKRWQRARGILRAQAVLLAEWGRRRAAASHCSP